MRVVVSGSHGLVGAALVSALQARGDLAVRLVRGEPSPAGEEIAWDPAAGTIDAASLEGFDAVVHLAGEGIARRRWSQGQRARIRASRVSATTLLARTLASLGRRPAVLVSASAVGYYGNRGDELIDEDSPPGEGFLAQVCTAWEGATAAAATAGIRVVRLRSGVVLARHGGILAPQLPLFKLGLGARLGSGRQYVSWITLEDEVQALLFALERASLSGPVNAVAPGPVTNDELTRAVARALHRPALLAVPAPILRCALGAGFADELLLASQRAWPRRLLENGFLFRYPDLGAALQALLAA
jgi:uncharacterized protein (TIGR01777 family)